MRPEFRQRIHRVASREQHGMGGRYPPCQTFGCAQAGNVCNLPTKSCTALWMGGVFGGALVARGRLRSVRGRCGVLWCRLLLLARRPRPWPCRFLNVQINIRIFDGCEFGRSTLAAFNIA